MDSESSALLTILLTFVLYKIFYPIFLKSKIIFSGLIGEIFSFFNNSIVITVFFVFLLELVVFIFYKTIKKTIETIKTARREKEEEEKRILNFLRIKVKDLESYDLEKIFQQFKNYKFQRVSSPKYKEKIKSKLKRVENRLIELEHNQELERIYQRSNIAKRELEKINKEIDEKKEKEEEEKRKIMQRLKIGIRDVFKTKALNPKEIKIAKENGYKQVNEYCVLEKKIINVLVKPVLNHSPTHIFLVWSAIRLLKKLEGVSRIKEHETVDADITFKFKNKTYAIEVEKGSLLRKKDQFSQKIYFLREKYDNRWIVLVSNKNLISKYKKFESISTRKDFEENLIKLLNSRQK